MSDIKKVHEIDRNSISNMLESLSITKNNAAYSTDINRFNDDCLKFINYIKECISDGNFYVLYMLREENIIVYGKYNHGRKIDKHTIEMIGNEDLKKLYELLQSKFPSDFVDGCKHTFGQGWSLNPTIGENIIIDINSDVNSDMNWFYEEVHKEQKSELSKKK